MSKLCKLTEWRRNRADAQRKAKMLRRKTRLPRETEKHFPRATVNPDSSSPSSPMQPCSTAALALRHLWDACFLNNLSPPLHTTWVLLEISAPYDQQICQEQQGHQSSWIFEYLPNLKLFDFKWKLGKEKDNILVCHLQSAFIKVLSCHFTKCYIIYFSLSQRGTRSSKKWNTFSKNAPLIDGGWEAILESRSLVANPICVLPCPAEMVPSPLGTCCPVSFHSSTCTPFVT